VLFFVISEKGHVNPTIGPAQALRDAGVDVIFYAPADISAQLASAGLTRFVGEVGPAAAPDATPNRGALFAERVRDAAWLRSWIKALLVDTAGRDVAPLREVIRRVRPDVVVVDPLIYASAIASELEGVPWVSMSNSLNPALTDDLVSRLDSALLRTVASLAEERRALFSAFGLAPAFRGCDVLSPHLTIAFTTEALVGEVPGVALVGPSLPRGQRGDEPEFPWDRLDGRPLVYASFGSQVNHQPAHFGALLDAVRGKDVQLVLSTGDLELGDLPSHVLARPYVPQLAVLRRASAFVTHGGANSVMEAIAAGVPMLVTPICNDQFHQAAIVARTGIGRTLDVPTAETAWEAIASLIADGPERARMREVAASYQLDGAVEAARRIIGLAEETRRAPAS
jgi:MGT family glycosyltransferase